MMHLNVVLSATTVYYGDSEGANAIAAAHLLPVGWHGRVWRRNRWLSL